jgi:hypothetical protein
VATPLASVVVDAGETDPPPAGTIQETVTPADACPESVTCTAAGIAVATTAVRLANVESTVILRPLADVDVPGVDGDGEDVVS